MAQSITSPSSTGFLGTLVRIAELAGWLEKPHPKTEQAEILRLAETSPHLLRDIGFRQNPDGTWSNGREWIAPTETLSTGRLRAWGMRV